MDYKFCPLCATELDAVTEKGRLCPACGFFYFPKVGTCAVGIVHDGDRILLDRRAYDPGKGSWALPGGYLESGEQPDDALKREVAEESGLDIEVGDLLSIEVGGYTCGIFYAARVIGGTLRKSQESMDIRWFDKEEIPWERITFRLHKKVLAEWLEGKSSRFV